MRNERKGRGDAQRSRPSRPLQAALDFGDTVPEAAGERPDDFLFIGVRCRACCDSGMVWAVCPVEPCGRSYCGRRHRYAVPCHCRTKAAR
jgi:hypothetical protein